jgi:DnaJ-domain-containing protein 1
MAQEEIQARKSALQPCVKINKLDQQIAICSPDEFLSILNALRECENEVGSYFNFP